ncbi:unnamed protein product, partial [marine sediment metagenome]
ECRNSSGEFEAMRDEHLLQQRDKNRASVAWVKNHIENLKENCLVKLLSELTWEAPEKIIYRFVEAGLRPEDIMDRLIRFSRAQDILRNDNELGKNALGITVERDKGNPNLYHAVMKAVKTDLTILDIVPPADSWLGAKTKSKAVDFVCAHCGHEVGSFQGKLRNHCPNCLWSLHVSNSQCRGLMKPIEVESVSEGQRRVTQQCIKCGLVKKITAKPDDNADNDCEPVVQDSEGLKRQARGSRHRNSLSLFFPMLLGDGMLASGGLGLAFVMLSLLVIITKFSKNS